MLDADAAAGTRPTAERHSGRVVPAWSTATWAPSWLSQLWSAEWAAFVWSSVPGAALATAAAVGLVSESAASAVFALSFVGLNLMHMGATWARVYVRPAWRARPLERLVVPLSLGAFALIYEAVGGGAVLLAAQYFLSYHHALMQNYGIVRVSQRRSGRVLDPRLDIAATLLLPGAALSYRAAAVCERYSGAPLPAIPPACIWTLAGAGVAALAAIGWREWRCHRRGDAVDPLALGILFGVNVVWSALLVADPHPAMPLYALASGHYVQYLYFVRRAECREPAQAETRLTTRLQLALRSSSLWYLVVLLGIAGTATVVFTLASVGLRAGAGAMGLRPAGALALAPWAAAMIGINLEHYWLDHRIWRVRARPALATAAA